MMRIETTFHAGRLLLCALASVLCFQLACESDEPDEPKPAEEQETKQDSDVAASGEQQDDLAKNREAFGLPLPPQVTTIDRSDDRVRVVTTLSLDELDEFYKSRLQDYEVLRPPQKIRAVGLRDYMPEIYGRRYAGTVRLFYTARKETPEAQADGADRQDDSDEKSSADGAQASNTKPLYKREKGELVRDRTADGELLAPGARWGEPYTPPPGSPLHKDRYRSNWGKPYGEWTTQ
jgi:hypothetical protein